MTDPLIKTSFVVGTAGHIDHGKSARVKALTGTDPDRLSEEKARGMTIDLGFAWLRSPAGRLISIVDVPGHERFIKNMLAGVGGIDAALLVIAADDGPKPQTREHLAILDLLKLRTGVIAVTKRDLVDQDWLDLVIEEIRETVAGTFLSGAPIVPVSSITGAGLTELRSNLDRVLAGSIEAPSSASPRLPVDRVFTVAGFGTVVTGTLTGGALEIGQEIEIMPAGLRTRVRGLQSHSSKIERALPGNRVAVNVASLAVEELRRGDMLTVPGLLRSSHRLDVQLQLLSTSPIALSQNDQLDLFIGSREVRVWLTLLDREQLEPGESGWVQLRTREPVAAMKGDRFIVRRPSPSLTIGGGVIVDANPPRHKRFHPEVLGSLETLAAGTPEELILQALGTRPLTFKDMLSNFPGSLSRDRVEQSITGLVDQGEVRNLTRSAGDSISESDTLVSTAACTKLSNQLTAMLTDYHRGNRLRLGMPREEIRGRLRLAGPARLFDELIRAAVSDGTVTDDGSTIRLRDFTIALNVDEESRAKAFIAALKAAPVSPPTPSEFGIDGGLLGALVDQGRVVKIAEGIVFDRNEFGKIERAVVDLLQEEGSLTLARFRDHFQTSRKYAQAILEYLDQRRITRRVGDERVRFTGTGAGIASGSPQ